MSNTASEWLESSDWVNAVGPVDQILFDNYLSATPVQSLTYAASFVTAPYIPEIETNWYRLLTL